MSTTHTHPYPVATLFRSELYPPWVTGKAFTRNEVLRLHGCCDILFNGHIDRHTDKCEVIKPARQSYRRV